MTFGPSAGAVRAPARRSNTATAMTLRDHVRPAITAGQRPMPDFWHPAGLRGAPAVPARRARAGGAARLAQGPPLVFAAIKEVQRESQRMTFGEAMRGIATGRFPAVA